MSQYQYHVFSLPKELLDTLVPRNVLNQPTAPTPSAPSRPVSPTPTAQPAVGSRACNVCLGATFIDVEDQRAHFRSDWHRYNVKVRLNGGEPVSEAHFAQLVDGLEDSISGSASSSEGDSADSDAVSALVHKTRKLGGPSSADDAPTISIPQTALVWFHSPPSTQIGIYKAIFSKRTEPAQYLDELKEMQHGGERGRTWAMFMTAGGHFAGAIVRVKRPDGDDDDDGLTKKGKPKRPKPEIEVLKHKTFHRYTTRRKQGGSQSINDNSKNKAISAGAMLRRYGEQALRDDIRNLLQDWAEDIHDCERIWIRASVSNRRIFLDYEGAIIEKGDERLRTFPFPTRRPRISQTQAELSRCLQELTRVKVSHLTEEALRAQDEALLAALPKPRPHPTSTQPEAKPKIQPAQPQLSPEEEALRDKWTRLLDMIRRGRIDTLKAFWEREGSSLGGVNAPVPEWTEERGGTLLQVAAYAGQEEVVRWLLEDLRADPTIAVPAPRTGAVAEADESAQESDTDAPRLPRARGARRTAYDLARTKAVRNVFRRCAAAHPDWWDWFGTEHGARVPSALSAEMEEEREEKKKARRKGLKEKVREREAREKEREASATPPPVAVEQPKVANSVKAEPVNGPRKLGGSTVGNESVAGLTPEMRAKVERERRARAAEARLKAMQGAGR
ncbi:hypothetical protein BN946_scf184951.g20 [Trametes cinnabarina]|uniref:VLRF1 domain-containing protein n=1 Tax=Pycnoporus cinnabarinus TaxID=5643 RepID=A0A060SMW0_PYCCI|nr:hypothetical protein BN946_scf184951.g20 [Trametes cinnabarina]